MTRRHSFVFRGGPACEELAVERNGSLFTVVRASAVERGRAAWVSGGRLSVLFEDGRQVCGRVRVRGDGFVEVSTSRGPVRLSLADPLSDKIAHSPVEVEGEGKEEEVRALMPGRVLEVCVAPGDEIEAGGLLLVLEAMKMQNEIRAAARGAVVRVHVVAGEAVEAGARLLAISQRPTI